MRIVARVRVQRAGRPVPVGNWKPIGDAPTGFIFVEAEDGIHDGEAITDENDEPIEVV